MPSLTLTVTNQEWQVTSESLGIMVESSINPT
jgi:hypothetical protein